MPNYGNNHESHTFETVPLFISFVSFAQKVECVKFDTTLPGLLTWHSAIT